MSRPRNGKRCGGKRGGRGSPGSYPHPLWRAMSQFLLPLLGPPRPESADGRTLWTPLLLAVSAVLVAWETAQSLGERLERACATMGEMFPGVTPGGGTYQGWVKALSRRKDLRARVAAHLRQCVRKVAGRRHWVRDGRCAFVVDGTRVDCPRTARNKKALGRAGRKGSGPQLYLTVIYHVGSGLPWAWEVGKSTASERKHLKRMLKLLPAGSLLVADAGLVGYDLLRAVRRRGLHFLIRVGSNASLLSELGYSPREGKQTAYLWPGKRRSRPPLALRLIEVRRRASPGAGRKRKAERKGKGRNKAGASASAPVWLLSDLPAKDLSDAAAGRFYALRWGVEVFFRSFKQKLGRRKMCSRTPARARAELHWSVIGLWLAQLMAVEAVVDAGHDPLSWSMAAAMRALRAAARGHGRGPGAGRPSLQTRLADCRKDGYRRTRPKSSRNWPHKKTDKPPGQPRLRIATDAEVLRAKEVYSENVAA